MIEFKYRSEKHNIIDVVKDGELSGEITWNIYTKEFVFISYCENYIWNINELREILELTITNTNITTLK